MKGQPNRRESPAGQGVGAKVRTVVFSSPHACGVVTYAPQMGDGAVLFSPCVRGCDYLRGACPVGCELLPMRAGL